MRKLVEKTMKATREVGDAVLAIQNGTETNIMGMQEAAISVNRSTDLAGEAGKALEQIVRLIDNSADQVRAIATASEQQSSTRGRKIF